MQNAGKSSDNCPSVVQFGRSKTREKKTKPRKRLLFYIGEAQHPQAIPAFGPNKKAKLIIIGG
jgi:hypothetical protein